MTFDAVVGIANVVGDIVGFVGLGFGFYVRATVREKIDRSEDRQSAKLDGAVKGLYDRINADDKRITQLEGKIDDMPRTRDVHNLSLQLSDMAGDLKAITAKMSAIEDSSKANNLALRRVEDHLFKVDG